MTNTELLRAVRQLGWSIIPTGANKKACVKWAEYQTRRPTSDELKSWIKAGYPGWAVVTGAISGMVCIDGDGETGKATLSAMGIEPHCKTGSDGRHYYVKHPGVPVRTLNGKSDPTLGAMYPGVDIRGDGGYAIFCGRTDKGTYEWLRPAEIAEWETLPQDLRDYVTGAKEEVEEDEPFQEPSRRIVSQIDELAPGQPLPQYTDPRHWLEHCLAKATKGNRNQTGLDLANLLRDQCIPFGVSRGECESIMREYADRVPRDPRDKYSHSDAMATFNKALSYATREPAGVPVPRATLLQRSGVIEQEEEIDLDTELARYAKTDLGNAERFLARHRQNLMHCSSFGKWYCWDGVRWQEDETGTVVQLAAATVRCILDEAKTVNPDDAEKLGKWARSSESEARLKSMVNVAKNWVGVSVDDLDADPWLLNCQNGVLDLRNGELLKHRQDRLITKLAPVNYNKSAKCPQWLRFLEQIFDGNQALMTYTQKAIGYALTGVIREQCLFFLYGKGANGKSTFLSTIQKVLGDYSMDTPTETLMAKQNDGGISNDVARLKGARLVTSMETEEGKRMAESLVKRLTGGDTITARFMRQEFFQFQGTFKIFLGANHKPAIRGNDDGIWRRIKLIPFIVQIPEADRDGELSDKLMTEAEGIFAWAMEGCRRWQKDGLGQPTEVTEAVAEYRDEMDFLGPFIAACCVMGPNESVKASELYKAYLDHCETSYNKPISQTKFGRMVAERAGVGKVRSSTTGQIEYRGIGIATIQDCIPFERGLNSPEQLNHVTHVENKTNSLHENIPENHSELFRTVQDELDYDPETEEMD